ncbi:MAG: histidinol-phosphate transaminase [Thermovirgaceae bacterium]|nr:histidinol-phosphate transaminase [Thermovirgaceae bacterium]
MRVAAFANPGISSSYTKIRLDKNENPFETPPGLIEELRMSISAVELNRYPDQEAASLKNALSEYCGFPPDWITLGNGGDEILLNLMMAFVPRDGCLMTLSPSFSGYEQMSGSLGVRVKRIPLEFDGESVTLREEKLVDALAASSPDMTIIDRPNNPTGLAVSTEFLKEVASLTRGVIVVDEAYVEFGGGSFLSNQEDLPSNVFVLRTFSKAWGLAGLRVGWGVSKPELCKKVEKVRPPFNVGVLPQEAARVALGYSEWMRARVNTITYTRDRFIEEVKRIHGWTALPSKANFVMVYSKCDREMTEKTFKKMGIHARFPDMGALSEIPGSWVRVTVGMEEEMGIVLDALKELSYRI